MSSLFAFRIYNYERFLGRTIQSVRDQTGAESRFSVSDNASTDRSMDIVQGFADPRIRWRVNRCNVGFAGNLDRAARPGRRRANDHALVRRFDAPRRACYLPCAL